MALPISCCQRGQIVLPSGATVQIRGLSRAEALQCRAQIPDIETVEKLSIQWACDVTEAEVNQWYATARNDDVVCMIEAIANLSGFSAELGKADAEG